MNANPVDVLRSAHPWHGFALYALEPFGPVTFEVISPEGESLMFQGSTCNDAIAQAVAVEPPPVPSNVFD